MLKILLFVLFLTKIIAECPPNWLPSSDASHYYLIPKIYLNWNDSVKYCQNLGGYLASVKNQIEYDALKQFAFDADFLYPVWIGLQKDTSVSFNRWKWLDGSVAIFTKFNSNSIVEKQCVAWRTLNFNDGFETIPCFNIQPFICKQDSATETTVISL